MRVRQVQGDTDRDLWSSVRQGSVDAYTEIYERHADAVYNYAFRRTGSWAKAEDVTSMVFLEGWRRRASTDLTHQSALPWLYGITNNVLRHQTRSHLRHQRMLSRLPPPGVEPDPAAGVVGRLEDERQMALVLKAMEVLTDLESEVVALCVWAGLGYAEASLAMGVPVGTVESRLARARQRLRDATREGEETP